MQNALVIYKRRKKKNKYNAQPTNGYASKGEAKRACYLERMQADGRIANLKKQVPYRLHAAGKYIGKYIADFVYDDISLHNDQAQHVEDYKGVETAMFKWKKKHVEAEYGIEVEVVK